MNEEELRCCRLGVGEWRCPVPTCCEILSRRQTLQRHLLTQHKIKAGKSAKLYKQYLSDPSIPVPKSTKFHVLQQQRSSNPVETPDADRNAESTSSEISSSPHHTLEPYLVQNVNLPPVFDLGHSDCEEMDMDINSDQEEFHGCENDENSVEIEHDYDDSSDEEQPHTIQTCQKDPPLYVLPSASNMYASNITRSEHVLATSAFCARHNLSDVASKDLLTLLQLHIPEHNTGETNIVALKDKCGFNKSYLNYQLYCDVCKKLFSDESENCKTPGCEGSKSDPQSRKYFVTSNIKQQLSDILQRDGMWEEIERSRSKQFSDSSISDIQSGAGYKELKEPGCFLHNSDNVTLSMFTDGVPLFKSSSVQIWPVYLLVNELPAKERFSRKNMILWGIWQGKGKPKMNMFLRPLVLDLLDLYKSGLEITVNKEVKQIKAMLILVTMDLQARAYVTHMTHHNGECGCLYCEEPGEVVASGKGTCRSYAVRNEVASLRTNEDIRDNARLAHEDGHRHQGFTGLSVLHYLPYFSLVKHIVIDYMHGTLLGITKKLLELWFDRKYAGTEHYIGDKIAIIDQVLLSVKPPYMVHRYPRTLSESHHWKASELRNWLLFYSVPCLQDHLPTIYLKHFSCLVESTYILLSEGISKTDLARADRLLQYFVANAAHLYGMNFVSLNVHNLNHQIKCVELWGPLWGFSCFAFESFNGEIKKNIHGTGNVCRQIFWTFQAQKTILQSEKQMQDGSVKNFISGMFEGRDKDSFGMDAYQCRTIKASDLKTELTVPVKEKLEALINCSQESCFQTASKIFRNGFFMYSTSCSKVKKQNSFTIALEQNTVDGGVAIEADQYLVHIDSKRVFCVGKLLKSDGSVLENYISHIHRLYYSGITVVKAELLREPMMIVKKDTDTVYGALFPNHCERD